MSDSNYIKNVAIVGAGGNSGSYMTKSLLETGKHNVTALSRAGSASKLPDGVKVVHIDYDKPETIVEALKGQDALVITLSVMSPQGTQDKLIQAAADAKVPWVLPNDWSPDTAHEGLVNDIVGFAEKPETRKSIVQRGMSWIAVACGFWYEYSLAIPDSYGIDCAKREAVVFDDGKTEISTSTWPQVGRAVAGLLSLPIQAEGEDKTHCLENFKNSHAYCCSFTVSQRDMLESAFRVTGTKEEDWKITHEPSVQRYKDGLEAMKKGDRMGFVRQMYTRVFFQDDSGNHEKRKGTINKMLGLPVEDLDEATQAGIEWQKNFAAQQIRDFKG